jgi:hypothetical protein
MCFAGRLDEFFAGGIELAVGDILGHACVEKINILASYRNLVTPHAKSSPEADPINHKRSAKTSKGASTDQLDFGAGGTDKAVFHQC